MREHVGAQDLLDALLGESEQIPRGTTRQARVAGLRASRDPDVDGVGSRVGRDHRIRRPQQFLAQCLHHERFADAGEAEGAYRDLRPDPAGMQAWQHGAGPHGPELPGRTRQRHDDRCVAFHPPPGGGSVIVEERLGSRDQPGLLPVRLRHAHPPPLEQLRQPAFQAGIHVHRLAEGLGERFAREVVGGRAQSAGAHDQVGLGDRLAKRGRDGAEVVREQGHPDDLHSHPAQVHREVPAVRVAGLAGGELAADCEDHGPGGSRGSHGPERNAGGAFGSVVALAHAPGGRTQALAVHAARAPHGPGSTRPGLHAARARP